MVIGGMIILRLSLLYHTHFTQLLVRYRGSVKQTYF